MGLEDHHLLNEGGAKEYRIWSRRVLRPDQVVSELSSDLLK